MKKYLLLLLCIVGLLFAQEVVRKSNWHEGPGVTGSAEWETKANPKPIEETQPQLEKRKSNITVYYITYSSWSGRRMEISPDSYNPQQTKGTDVKKLFRALLGIFWRNKEKEE